MNIHRLQYEKIVIILNKHKKNKVVNLLGMLEKNHLIAKLIITSDFQNGISCTKQAWKDGYRVFVAAGGDGTCLSVINGLSCKKDALVTILPLGTANDYARNLGIYNYQDTFKALMGNGIVKTVDLIKCVYCDNNNNISDGYANLSSGVGFLANLFRIEKFLVIDKLKSVLGDLLFVFIGLIKFLFMKGKKLTIIINDTYHLELKALGLEISKSKILGPICLTPEAKINNRVLDVAIISQTNFFKKIIFLNKIFNKKQTISQFTIQKLLKLQEEIIITKIKIESKTRLPIHLNACFMGYTPCEFAVLPEALKMLALDDRYKPG